MPNLPPLSLYLHIPWCVQKCPYCDFNSHALKGEVPHQDYVDHLLADLSHDLPLTSGRAGNTLFIGCGAHGKLTQPDGTVLRTVKTRHPRGYMQGNYLAKRYPVAPADLPFEYFMNRFRLLEAAPRAEFIAFTGLAETTVRPALDQALAVGYISESDSHWQVTDKGKLFLNSLLELFM
ncbi:hypothetical protein [Candidatus Sodalis pierantonius]|uniref:hypothetical protein n=1 Tax=Candidatus Sodalis pierantonii TaxID=1486991 RepID=UPI00046C9DE4|nr:hypothetical protein [Candidatus Sodalis pierantonius]